VVPWLAGAKQLALGANHSCLIRADGQAACWGTNRDGELGDGTMTDRSEPALIRW
jgi:alpha-tubulin suppressor-like RCC1 family protein